VAGFGRKSFKPDLAVPNGIAQAIVDRVLPGRTLAAVTCLQGGEMGAVYELSLAEAHRSLVLKVYPQEFQWKMRKEVAVIGRLDGRLTVPIPRILLVDDSKSLLDLNFVVMNKLDGEVLAALEDDLVTEEVLSAYTQMGRLLRECHQIPMEAFGYIGPHGLWSSQPTNHAYVTNRFESKSEEFIERGGDPGLARRVAAYVRAHEDLLHACALPVLCHNDFHARNVLASKGSGTLRLSGILDFEGAQAADPLMDLAKTLYCCPDVDDAKRAALLDGYGEPARKNWRKTVELYYLYYILEFWCWMALLGNAEPLPRLAAQMEGYTAT
jgi:aminoglycoside phosphotransferase (APT) family kinase protein